MGEPEGDGRLRAIIRFATIGPICLPRKTDRASLETLYPGVAVYETPKLERLGTLRELTLAGGEFAAGDGANPYHRYTAPA